MACLYARRAAPLTARPLGVPGGTPERPDAGLMALADSPVFGFLDALAPSQPSNVLRAVARGQVDQAALGAACILRDYYAVTAAVATIATPLLLLAGGIPGVLSGVVAGISGLLVPLFDAICKQQAPNASQVAAATRGATAAANAARAGGVTDLEAVDPDAVALVGAGLEAAAATAGKTLPRTAPQAKAGPAYTQTQRERARQTAIMRIRRERARRAAKARITIRRLAAQRPRQGGPLPSQPKTPTAPKKQEGGALPWLIGLGIAAKVFL